MDVNFSNNWQTRCGWLLSNRGRWGQIAKREKIAAFKILEGSDRRPVNESTPRGRHLDSSITDRRLMLAGSECLGISFKDWHVCVRPEISSWPISLGICEGTTHFGTAWLTDFNPLFTFWGQPPILRSHFPFVRCGLPQLLIPDHNERKFPLWGPASPVLDTMSS